MKNYCLFVCFDGINMNHSVDVFVSIVQDLSQSLNINLTHIDYSFIEEEDEEFASTHESFFSSEVVTFLNKALQTKALSGLALWSAQNDLGRWSYPKIYAELVDAGLGHDYKYIVMSFPMILIEDMAMTKIFSLTSQLLASLKHLGKPDYGFVTTINPSLVSTYFRGIFTSNLSDEEALDIAMWENRFVERKNLLRGLFWGNLLSSNHLIRIPDFKKFLSRLELSVDSLHNTITDDDLFFMLPTTNTKSDLAAEAVRILLKEYDLIMEPDNNDREVVSRLVSRS